MDLLDYIVLYLALEILLDSNSRNIKMDSNGLSKNERQTVVKFKQIIKQVQVW